MTDEQLNNIRVKALKLKADRKQRIKEEYLSTLATMKIYPKKNPNAINMLVVYTIWSDLKAYHVPSIYFYNDAKNLTNNMNFERFRIFDIRLNTMLTLALESERVLKNLKVKV